MTNEINNFNDALKDDSPENLNRIVETFTGNHAPMGNNVLITHLINNIKKLDSTTTNLNQIMICLIVVQIVLVVVQIFLSFRIK